MENYRRRRNGGGGGSGSGTNILMIVMIVVFAAVVITAAVLLIKSMLGSSAPDDGTATSSESVQDQYDPAAEKGALPGRETSDDIEDADNFSYVINTEPEFKNGKAEGNILIENPAHNEQLMRVEITGEDGELLYASGFIRPGWHIKSIKLLEDLDKGDYFAEAAISAYDRTSKEVVTTAYQELTLVILK